MWTIIKAATRLITDREQDGAAGRNPVPGMLWATVGAPVATACFWLGRGYLDNAQAFLLYLPMVIALAIRFGFFAAVLAAVLSFFCWNFFLIPPYHTLIVDNPRDWLSLIVFLIAAITTARLASQARIQAEAARTREQETLALYQASETLSREIDASRLLPAIAERVVAVCDATRCVIMRRTASGALTAVATAAERPLTPDEASLIGEMCRIACERDQVIGFGSSGALWARALEGENSRLSPGVCAPLRVEQALVGALHVGPRHNGRAFSDRDRRLILALANHAAVVIARQTLADEAAQANALREADTLKDALLSMVTHELRTPLAAIKAASSGLRQRHAVWPEAARDEAIATIDVEADRLTTLVSNLLDLSRLEAGSWNPSKDWCDLTEIVGTALDRLPERDALRVQVSVEDELPLIRADYVQLALVVTNLLENAVKYGPPGSPIELRARKRQADANPRAHTDASAGAHTDGTGSGKGIQIAVRDFGDGIAAGEEEDIFTRFYRSPRHANSSIHGTGLGLALCRAIVEAHGGRIWAANAPSGEPSGAVFSFILPME